MNVRVLGAVVPMASSVRQICSIKSLFLAQICKFHISWKLITCKAAHIKVTSELHESINWKKCNSFNQNILNLSKKIWRGDKSTGTIEPSTVTGTIAPTNSGKAKIFYYRWIMLVRTTQVISFNFVICECTESINENMNNIRNMKIEDMCLVW